MEKREELYNYYKSKFNQIEIDNNNLIKKFTSVKAEYDLLKNGVSIRDLSNYSKIFMHGKDTESLLRRLTTNRIVEMDVLEWVKTLFVNSDGNIIDRTLLMKFEDYFILVGSNTEENKLYKWINRFIIDDDISISNSNDDYTLFEVMGEQATSYMTMILGDKFEGLNDKNILRVQIDNFFVHGIKLNDCGIDKYVILVDSIHAVKTLEIMQERKSVFDLGMVGEDAYNIFRIENGIPIAPNELNDSVNPIEVNLHEEISSQKHDYIGHESVEENSKDLSKLVKIRFDDLIESDKLPLPIIDKNNDEIGVVTSVADASIVKPFVGLGFIDSEFHLNGNEYAVLNGDRIIRLDILDLKET